MITARTETLIQKGSSDNSSEILEKIGVTKPLLLNMAEQVLETDRDRWNVIIGDDAGGRLPTHFIHDVLRLDNRDVKTFFIASSSIYRYANGPEPYEAYFDYITEQLGEPLRPLVVTESVGTGGAIDFLKTYLQPHSSQEPEFATVAVSEESLHKVNFAGGVGASELDKTWHAYESPPANLSLGRRALRAAWKRVPDYLRQTIESRTSPTTSVNNTVGIYVDVNAETPIAKRSDDRDGQVSTDAYRLMDELAIDAYEMVRENTHQSVA